MNLYFINISYNDVVTKFRYLPFTAPCTIPVKHITKCGKYLLSKIKIYLKAILNLFVDNNLHKCR